MKYGVKVIFPDGEYLWVTVGDSKFQIEPLLFDSKELAQEYALNTWGDYAIVELYGQNKNS